MSFELFEYHSDKDDLLREIGDVRRTPSEFLLADLRGVSGVGDRQIFCPQHRGIGEMLALPDGANLRCMRLSEFLQNWSEPEFLHRFESLTRLLDGIGPTNEYRWKRLELMAIALERLRGECRRLVRQSPVHWPARERLCPSEGSLALASSDFAIAFTFAAPNHALLHIPQIDGEYVARMEDVLDLYAESPDPKRPVVCFDESPTQLIGEVREPIPAKPGQRRRYDYEYKRNGTVNLFVFLDAHRPWRKVKVTDSRTAVDFAACMRDLTDVHYPKAEPIRVVLDNLSTHSAGALYEAFPARDARRVLERLEFHYVPKHASWLNMVEIEIGVLRGQCLDRRIGTRQRLESEILAWERQRNAARARIKWMFTIDKARTKMGRASPCQSDIRCPILKES